MKKTLLFFSAAFIACTTSFAQCSQTIPPLPGHVQISSNQNLNAVGMIYWVCEGVTLDIISSTGATYFLEENVTLNIQDSDGDQIFAKANCVINNNSAESIGIAANPANVTMNNNSTGTLTVTTTCSAITYDYMFVGGSACTSTATGIEEVEALKFEMYPNPIVSGSTVTISSNESLVDGITIFNAAGQVVYSSAENTQNFSTANLSAGYYVVEAHSDHSISRKTLVVTNNN